MELIPIMIKYVEMTLLFKDEHTNNYKNHKVGLKLLDNHKT